MTTCSGFEVEYPHVGKDLLQPGASVRYAPAGAPDVSPPSAFLLSHAGSSTSAHLSALFLFEAMAYFITNIATQKAHTWRTKTFAVANCLKITLCLV